MTSITRRVITTAAAGATVLAVAAQQSAGNTPRPIANGRYTSGSLLEVKVSADRTSAKDSVLSRCLPKTLSSEQPAQIKTNGSYRDVYKVRLGSHGKPAIVVIHGKFLSRTRLKATVDVTVYFGYGPKSCRQKVTVIAGYRDKKPGP